MRIIEARLGECFIDFSMGFPGGHLTSRYLVCLFVICLFSGLLWLLFFSCVCVCGGQL